MKYLNRTYQQLLTYGLIIISLSIASCKKLVDVPAPETSISSKNVYSTDATAIAALTGIYTNLSSFGVYGGLPSTSVYTGLSADELALYNTNLNTSYIPFYKNTLTNINSGNGDLWKSCYPVIYAVNAAIEGLTNNDAVTPAVRQQLTGEALFMRALCYFYLINLYGDVPLVTTTDATQNSLLARASKITVYQQIVKDLKMAESLLSGAYLDGSLLHGTPERVRPTKWAASALLARTYLYTGDWPGAEAMASQLIDSSGLFKLGALDNLFLKQSPEAIWQLQPVTSGQNTPDAAFFILPASGPNSRYYTYLNPDLIKSFEPGDQRLTNWVDSVKVTQAGISTTYYYPFKYKVNAPTADVTEYEIVFRLGEQYLIRAEARAQQQNISGARSDLDTIRTRAGLVKTTATSQADVLAAILHERQVELFTEWGHRWMDLKRTGKIDQVMSAASLRKGSVWKTEQQLYPIALQEIQRGPNLIQNPGY